MMSIRTVILPSLLAGLLFATAVCAAEKSGLWLATVAVNKVGEVNRRVQDAVFDLGVSAAQSETPLISKGSSWSYYDKGALGQNWQSTSTLFSNWTAVRGRAPLGYTLQNASYVAPAGGTKVSYGSDPANKNLSTYFRKTFTIADTTKLKSARMRIWADDASQAFLNGTPVYSDNLTADWAFVTAGAHGHSAALRSDGALYLWGINANGRLGDGTNTDRPTPVRIGGTATFKTVATGSGSTVAVKSDGTLWSWGYSGFGQLGDGVTVDRNTPQQVGSDATWQSVAAGWDFALAIKSDGTLWGWGLNSFGQIGVGSYSNMFTPTQIGTDSNWKTVTAGYAHSAAIKSDGTLWLWGRNGNGQLGIGSTTNSNLPAQVGGSGSKWRAVSPGLNRTLAIMEDGTLWEWGVVGSTPQQVGSDTDWRSTAVGDTLSLAIKSDGSLWGWGTDTFGVHPSNVTYATPTRIGADSDWLQISAATYNFGSIERALALRGSGVNSLWGWGANTSGRLGDGTTTDRPMLTALPSFFSAVKESPNADPAAAHKEVSIPVSALVNGTNNLAVEVYGAGPANPDLYFDLELTAVPTDPVNLITEKSSGWKYLDAGTGGANANPTSAGSYTRRVPLTISDFVTNYQIKMTITYDQDMRADFGDLRFYDATAGVFLPYWVESKTDGLTITVWFKTGTNNNIHLMFGNPGAASSSNGSSTFDFFDGFDGTAIDTGLWTVTSSDGFSVSGGTLHGTNTTGRLTSKAIFSSGVILEIKAKTITKAPNGQTTGGFYLSSGNNIGLLDHPTSAWYRSDSVWTSLNADIPANNTLYSLKVKSANTVQLSVKNFESNASIWSSADISNTVSNEPITLGKRFDDNHTGQTYATDWDWIRVRKYAATEPTVALGTKEITWNQSSFADTAWSTGSGPLGFGRSDLGTTVANSSVLYYRKAVTVSDPSLYSALNLRLLRDDGAVVYLNGKEIFRSNMPAGTITANTAPEQIIGQIEGDRYVTATIPLAAGDLLAGNNVFSVEIHQHPAELLAATTPGLATPTSGEFPLRLLLHVDAAGTVRLLKEAIQMKESSGNKVILADVALASGYQGVVLRGDTLVGVRSSAIGYDFSGRAVNCNGTLGTSGSASCSFSLPATADTNPFLHRFHPDHDNLDEQFATTLSGNAAEAYDLTRSFTLTFSSRYPANPDEPERSAVSRPPGWGTTQLGGVFSETIGGVHKNVLNVAGWFTMKKISPTTDLRLQ